MLTASVARAVDIDSVVAAVPITEGNGIEGVLTIFDRTPRMIEQLGDATDSAQGKYFYRGTLTTLIVEAPFRDGHFPVASIVVRSRDPRVHTGSGVHMLDTPDRVTALLGEPAVRSPTALEYPGRGLTVLLGKAEKKGPVVVVGVEVRRKVAEPDTAPAVSPAPTPSKLPPPGAADSAPTGLVLPLGDHWVPVTPLTSTGGVLRSESAEIEIEACSRCTAQIEAKVKALEAEIGPNRLPLDRRRMDKKTLAALNVDDGYAGLYGLLACSNPTWILALEWGERAWLVRIGLKVPPDPKTAADLVTLFTSIRRADSP